MAHNVICLYCKKKFDRDKVDSIKVSSTRYAHAECVEKFKKEKAIEGKFIDERVEAENRDSELLKDYINTLLPKPINWALVMKQIKTYHADPYNYSYSGMLKSLKYAYEIKHEDISKAYGVGIIPYAYKDAFNYYYSIWEANQKNAEKKIESFEPKEEILKIKIPKRVTLKKKQLFMFLEEDKNGI